MSNILESMRLGIDTEPTGLQAAARLMGERDQRLADSMNRATLNYAKQQEKIAELVLAAVTAAGQMVLTEDEVWRRRGNYDVVWESQKAREALLKAIQELGS